jgi:hypothetical protein
MYNRDIEFMTLDEINTEIAAFKKLPIGQRSVRDADRLRDLEFAQRRIRGLPGRRFGCR